MAFKIMVRIKKASGLSPILKSQNERTDQCGITIPTEVNYNMQDPTAKEDSE